MIAAPFKRAAGLAATALIAVAAGLAAPPPAPAAADAGATTLTLRGPAAKTLRAQGVRVVPVKPARGGARQVVLPVAGSLAGTRAAVVSQRGQILLKRGGRKLRLRKLAARAGRKGGRIEATVGKRKLVLFRLGGGRRKVVPASGEILIRGARLKLTGGARRLIAKRLGIELDRRAARRLAKQRFGQLTLRVGASAGGGSGGSGGSGGGGGGGGGAGTVASCPLPSGAGPAPETPVPVKPRPAGALDIVAATIDWHVRESFVRYINTGEGTSVSGGASADPPVTLPGTSAALTYGFHFPFAAGWLDPGASAADPADDSAVIGYGGAVRFRYSGHEIDLTTAAPEIELDGAASRAIFSISDGGGPAAREVLFNLDLSRARAISVSGSSHTYEAVPGAIPAGTADSTFAGFYTPGTDFGCVDVSFTTG